MLRYNKNMISRIIKMLIVILAVFVVNNTKAYASTISFNSHGGESINSITQNINEELGTLPTVTKTDYIFDGWYKEDTYQNKVSSKTIVTGDMTLHAKWVEATKFPYVYGPYTEQFTCTGSNYINTNVYLYDDDNWKKDYEIGITIDEYDPTENVKQAVFINAKSEQSAIKWPGFVFRRMNATNDLEITQSINMGNRTYYTVTNWTLPYTLKILRIDKVVYYEIEGERYELQDMSDFNQQFDIPTYFCAGDNGSGGTQRHLKGKISNYYIKMGTYEEEEYHTVTYPDGSVEVYLHNTMINLGDNVTPKVSDITSVTFKKYNGEADEIRYVTNEYTGNGFDINGIHYDDEATLLVDEDKVIENDYIKDKTPVTFPSDPTLIGYTFDGWYDDNDQLYTTYDGDSAIILHARYNVFLPTGITISNADVTLAVGETETINVTFSPVGSLDTLTYTGYDNSIIDISNGIITALSKGTTTITVGLENVNNVTKTIEVTVISNSLESNSLEIRKDNNNPRVIIGTDLGTTIQGFKNDLLNDSVYIKIYDENDNLVSDNTIVKTGYKIKLEYNGLVLDEAIMIVRGDVDKDGYSNISDYILVVDHIVGTDAITDYAMFTAADIIENEILNTTDYTKIMEYGLENIQTLNN